MKNKVYNYFDNQSMLVSSRTIAGVIALAVGTALIAFSSGMNKGFSNGFNYAMDINTETKNDKEAK